MIYEITGQPGHGKSLYGMHLVKALKKLSDKLHQDKPAEFAHRDVYSHGVPGLEYERLGFQRLEDPRKWQDLPDNAIILIDECYSTFPNRNAAAAVPPHVEAMARHRHRGFDFFLIHQSPNQVDPFVRGLVDEHYHVRRKFRSPMSVIKRWDRACTNPIKEAPLSSELWKHERPDPPDYLSTTQDTTGRLRVPWFVWIVIPLLAFVVWQFGRLGSGDAVAAVAPHAPAKAGVGGASGAPGQRVPRDYKAFFTPRIEGIPWTAPAYDNMAPAAPPSLYCMSSEFSCTCLTEQGTRVAIKAAVCRYIAEHGIYNPYRQRGSEGGQRGGSQERPAVVGPEGPTDTLAGIRTEPSAVGGEGRGRVWGK